jgi:O-acetylhomoserine (thiol)-lyase
MRLVPLRNLGACISPDNAWMFLQGLETLPLRMQRHSENAAEIARFLKEHPQVEWVRYPGLPDDPTYPVASKYLKNGFGGMVVFGIKGGFEAGPKFVDSLKLFSQTTHSQLSEEQQKAAGLTPDLVRLSVGLEHIDDIKNDLEQAFAQT